MSVQQRRQSGFTLIELLVVVGVIAIIAAIALISYRNVLDRARQRRTVNDIRVIAGAWESRATDVNSYAIPGFTFPDTPVTPQQFYGALVPTYTKYVPSLDGWNRPLEFATGGGPKEYGIRSAGRDGEFQGPTYTPGETDHFDCDIVFANGSFVLTPKTANQSN